MVAPFYTPPAVTESSSFCFYFRSKISSYIPDTIPLLDLCFTKIPDYAFIIFFFKIFIFIVAITDLSHFLPLYHFLNSVFEELKFFTLMKSNLSIFFLLLFVLFVF